MMSMTFLADSAIAKWHEQVMIKGSTNFHKSI